MSPGEDDIKIRRQEETERLKNLHSISQSIDDKNFPYTGVLLGDAIKYCVQTFDLIQPFEEKNLKPANYKLTIGEECAISGEIIHLSDPSQTITIEPFQVAIIKTRETLNMPAFLIGRWNIRVQLAYQGLLWVGGPQVDAGYVGHLFCPVYNLSHEKVVLHYKDCIAVIDFVRTSQFQKGKSPVYQFVPPERLLIEDYNVKQLHSALYTFHSENKEFERRIGDVEGKTSAVQQRIDQFVTITFMAIAVLFAALSVAGVGRQSPSWQTGSVFLLSGFAIFVAASAWVTSKTEGRLFPHLVRALVIAGIIAAVGFQIIGIRKRDSEVNTNLQRQQNEIMGLSRELQELKAAQSRPSVGEQGPRIQGDKIPAPPQLPASPR